jgi:uncharacterized protein YggE
MFRTHKIVAVAAAALAAGLLVVLPALAQTETPQPPSGAGYPVNTISVTGTGTVHAAPDMATVDVGVDVVKPTVTEAFTEANSTAQKILDALTALGISADDIQTNNLSVYSTTQPNAETGKDQPAYDVSNTVHVIVRDISKVQEVIDAAVKAGATSLNGLSFGISDTSKLESQARELAMQDAAARAAEYATLANGKLGDAIIISENRIGSIQPVMYAMRAPSAAGSAVVSPGQTDVQIQVSVTYQIVR